MISPGRYIARASDWRFTVSSTGSEQLAVSFQLEAGDTLTWWGSFSDKALPHTMKALRAMGWRGTDLAELDNHGGGLDGQQVELVVEESEYQGRVSPKVRWVNSLGGISTAKGVDAGGMRAFSARMRSKIAALEGGSRPAPRAPPQAKASLKGDGEDIPF